MVGSYGHWKSDMPEFLSNLPPFLTLQDEHAVTTLFQSVLPPFDLGNKWSKVSSLLLPQY